MKKSIPTPYPELNNVLEILVNRVQDILCANFVGVYLQGSFAVGDFDLHSDVDYITVIAEELSEVQVHALQAMHERIYCLESLWAQHLEGSYFPQDVFRSHDQLGQKLWYLDNGARALIQDKHSNTILVRWVVRENGVTLAGPPPKTIIDPIPIETLRKDIYETLNYWGNVIIDDPDQFSNHFYQTYIVLNYCRMLHDLHRGYPGSKLAGAEWAKANIDPSWGPLIDRTLVGRPVPEVSVKRPANPEDFESTLKFVKYIMEESNKYAAKNLNTNI